MPAVLTKAQTSAASSSAPCCSLGCDVLASVEKAACDWACELAPFAFVDRIQDIWPLVLSMAPDVLSSTMVACTPAFLDSLPKVSSSASALPDWKTAHQYARPGKDIKHGVSSWLTGRGSAMLDIFAVVVLNARNLAPITSKLLKLQCSWVYWGMESSSTNFYVRVVCCGYDSAGPHR